MESTDDHNLFYLLGKSDIKMHLNLDYILSQYTDDKKFGATDLKIKVILYLAMYQLLHMESIPDYAAINEAVEMAKSLFGDKVADFVNAVLRSWQRQKIVAYPEALVKRLSVEYSFPEKVVSEMSKLYGEEELEYMFMHFNEAPLLHIRVNKIATNKKKLLNYFGKKNIEFTDSKLSENILISAEGQKVINDVAFEEGYYSFQDTAQALVVELLNPLEHESILDLFAGRGGKTAYIAELMNNTGEVIAVDKIPNKTKQLKQALERLQIDNVQIVTADAFHFGPVAPAYDKVLLDVPCSGWGVFQRKSELRWQFNQDMPSLIKLQAAALQKGASFVKAGGFLIYSTCTLNYEENEKQVENFLQQNPNFSLVRAEEFVNKELTQNGYFKTLPHKHNTDGAFAAKMVKTH